MTQDISGLLTPACELLAFGEPAHSEPAFTLVRNELFAQLVEHGFRSIAIESDRVAGLLVDDHVRHGVGSSDDVVRDGISHGFGELEGNRRLVAWMREYNEGRPAAEQLAFHGIDVPHDQMSPAPPRPYLEHVRAYLGGVSTGWDADIAGLAGDDERWSTVDAVMDPARSVGTTPEAARLRVLADDMTWTLHARAPQLVAATSQTEWMRARTYLGAAVGLLRYHHQAAQPLDRNAQISGLAAMRDAWMAENLLDVRAVEARRGPTMVFAHNMHLQRGGVSWSGGGVGMQFNGAGAIIASLVGERYAFVAGSLGASTAVGLAAPAPDTYEGSITVGPGSWAIVPTATGRPRDDHRMEQGYVPLDQATIDGADAILHVEAG
jgi:erythromycin esterase-like protein